VVYQDVVTSAHLFWDPPEFTPFFFFSKFSDLEVIVFSIGRGQVQANRWTSLTPCFGYTVTDASLLCFFLLRKGGCKRTTMRTRVPLLSFSEAVFKILPFRSQQLLFGVGFPLYVVVFGLLACYSRAVNSVWFPLSEIFPPTREKQWEGRIASVDPTGFSQTECPCRSTAPR